ncbi:phosphatidylethanolamine methyltransferase [Grosmannia clavigera kw1407]|uniref:Phosphatidylethanolamine N-methyltransferase n=1 Tax=Grosmannia clavigera (strain kw1407 / UAMH 11150) TaxID=655863 RepID=F0XUN2_GROCL|nr:phosphatidylethanolamine methyltransferase [Grosmannia clavigera kw1407]EFW98694.1 phosphatidylethanolamine methyltransferase [Grosmannia clavigera kw1407]
MSSAPDAQPVQETSSASASALRQRHGATSEPAEAAVRSDDILKPKKTYGRTPDGTVFTVPTTHDMVSQLLDPRQPKNLSDVTVLVIIGLHILAAYLLPAGLKRPVFAAIFIFWRASYNIGIGSLLTVQSKYRLLVQWAKRWRLFENPATGKNPRPWLYRLLKQELETKIPEDYTFEKAPVEYNTWLVFRRVVDLILMCDFVSYCLFAVVCGHRPEGESLTMAVARWGAGIALVGFNLWVKLDAHRVVKDFAWYWGDFFYLIDQELTFDGVFEMAPHPMYSIGYAGYYGISMMAASYDVLFISIAAHLTQLIFLAVVENPHIEKTYNPPQPRARADSDFIGELQQQQQQQQQEQLATADEPLAAVHGLWGIANFDMFRITDYSVILLGAYVLTLAFVTPATPLWQGLFFAHAVAWRLWYNIGLGAILRGQSSEKQLTRHFLKFGDTAGEAWRQWKGMYHVSMALCHVSFVAACWKMYSPPADWHYGWAILKHVLGSCLVALQMWTAVSIYDELGEFGWFYGDFFFDSTGKLTYKSIYRYLNNPERVIGTAGLWGAALITWSRSIFVLAMISQLLMLAFLEYVEKPHMQKIYGRKLRGEAGLTKFIRKSLPPPVKEWQQSVDRVLDETRHFVEEFVDAARPKLAAGVSTMVRDTTALFNKYPARLTTTRLSPDLAGFDPKYYSLSVEGANGSDGTKPVVLPFGAPIRVRWTAPVQHKKKDWVGLYMVTDNRSREVTEVPSLGRWVPTCPGVYDTAIDRGIVSSDEPLKESGREEDGADEQAPARVGGEMVFEGDQLWWTQGVFEFRYHHDGNHSVMAISQPFEVRIDRFDNDEDVGSSSATSITSDKDGLFERAVEAALLPMVQNCFDRDPDIAPTTADELFGEHVERDSKYARRVVYAIQHMFGIEFAPAVVPADATVRKLAYRICNAKQVLHVALAAVMGGGTVQPDVLAQVTAMSDCIEFRAPAVVEWESEGERICLADADPRSARVTFEGRLHEDATACSFFQLHIPVRLRGVTRDTTILMPLYPDAIDSLEPERFPAPAPAAVDKKLRGSCVCLRFRLRRPIPIIVPITAAMPLRPFRRPTGDVLDRLRSLVHVTALDVYVPDLELSSAKLQAIQTRLAALQTVQRASSRTRSRPPSHDLRCLFDGTGGKIVDRLDDSPPAYDQIGPPPPLAPIVEPDRKPVPPSDHKAELEPAGYRKRRRRERDSPPPDDIDSRLAAIWAELRRKDDRIEQLEARVQQLEHDREEGAEETATLRRELDKAVAANEELEGQLLLTGERLDGLVDEVAYIQENGLDSEVEDRIVETVTDCVFEQISENATVTFTRT